MTEIAVCVKGLQDTSSDIFDVGDSSLELQKV